MYGLKPVPFTRLFSETIENMDLNTRGEPRDGAWFGARAIYFALALAVIAIGLALRLIPAGLPVWLVKWGGSVLWAAMVYLLLAASLPRRGPVVIGTIAGVVAAVVELSRLYHSPGLDAFRLTRAGALLLGRVFSWWHFVAYGAAIGLVAAVDAAILRRKRADSSLD